MSNALNCNIAIIGGGTAGLALATELKRLGVDDVVILEREPEAGGVPRHCGHYPFGLKEFNRVMKGPDYARALVARAKKAEVDIRNGVTVTALHPKARLTLSTAEGHHELQANRVVLATGVRESSRAQRFLSGERPQGVITTGALQSMVYLHHQRPFKNPVILGSELVSFSAIMTCRHMGMRPIAMIEEAPRVTVRSFMRPYPALMGVKMYFKASDIKIHGQRQVEALSFTTPAGHIQTIKTDGIIVSGQFRPEAALLHASHLEVDPGTGGPIIDQYNRCSDPCYFSTGNVLRPVETSSWCHMEAVETAARIAHDLHNPIGDAPQAELTSTDPAIRYVVPQRLTQTDAPHAMTHAQLRLTTPTSGLLVASADGATLWSAFLDSRPERRILAPLARFKHNTPQIKLSIQRNS